MCFLSSVPAVSASLPLRAAATPLSTVLWSLSSGQYVQPVSTVLQAVSLLQRASVSSVQTSLCSVWVARLRHGSTLSR